MGLTGVIIDATIRLIPIETSRCRVLTERIPNLDALLDAMATGDHLHRYSVAWVDMVATGAHLGRAVLTRGDHATYDELVAEHPAAGDDPLEFRPAGLASVPAGVPNVLNKLAVRAFNELWYRKAPRSRVGIETITGFFHPLDMVGHWNRLYGRAGFLQYQFVLPFEEVDTLRSIVSTVASSGQASFLAVLKRMGPSSGGMISFPTPGWTLTLDLPAGGVGLAELLSRSGPCRPRRRRPALSRQGRHDHPRGDPRRLPPSRRVARRASARRSRRDLDERPGPPTRSVLTSLE